MKHAVKPGFVGQFWWTPIGPPGAADNEYQMLSDYGFLRADNKLVIAPIGAKMNGASIPRVTWWLTGHPLEKENKYWSCHHDAGYRGTARILNMEMVGLKPEEALALREEISAYHFLDPNSVPRSFWDETLRQAMTVCREPMWKRVTVYRAVRMFGGMAGLKERKARASAVA